MNGGGVALFDYDGDGDLDIFLVNGSTFDWPVGEDAPRDRLYRNDGGWSFTDVSDAAGIAEDAWGCGVAVADIDNDGDLDLYVTNYGPDELWVNDGDGTFTRSGASSGANDPRWGASCTFLDYDRDGWVDLFVVNYLEFDRAKAVRRGKDSCQYKGQQILCGPVGLPKEYCTLYRNLGGGRFEDVSDKSGVRRTQGCYGLGVVVGDYDSDGWPDVYVSADTTDNLLFHNLRNGTFEEIGLRAGVARNDDAIQQAGMGVDFGYVRNARYEDILVVNYEDDNNTYYANDGNGFFTEITSVAGLGCFKYLGWGTFFADFNYDGQLDSFVAQGHVIPQADLIASSPGYRQKNKLFLGTGAGRFRDVTDHSGPGLQVKKSSRGAACGDLDGDGDLDLVINDIDDTATVLECAGPPLGHWLGVRAVGTQSNRAAIGAVIRIETKAKAQARRVRASSGYASHSELTARFGLGDSTAVDRLEVEWPSGHREIFPVRAVDRVITVTEGQGEEVDG